MSSTRTRLLGLAAAASLALVILTGACGGGSGASTCGVAGATQACLCGGGVSGAQSCQADGAWGACACVPGPCEGVTCKGGGVCVVNGNNKPLCDCPAGVFGGDCGGVCTASALTVAACDTVTTPGQWYPLDPETPPTQAPCERPHRFAVRFDGAGSVTALTAPKTDTPPAAMGDFTQTPMTDGNQDGTWEAAVLLVAGTPNYVAFLIDGAVGVDNTQPVDPDTGLNLLTLPACDAAPDRLPCGVLFGDGTTSVSCATTGPGCVGTAVTGYWFGVALPTQRAVTELRFRSDWWRKRPAAWELWASDDATVTPDSGASVVAIGEGRPAPWECVTGEPCDDDAVPEECCPDGRGQPQRVPEGAHIAKWDVHPVMETRAQFFYFRVASTVQTDELVLEGLELVGHDCPATGGYYPPPGCEVYGVGPAAGCPADAWCAPGMGPDLATAGCAPIGPQALGDQCARGPCSDTEPCREFQCGAGLVCTSDVGYEACTLPCDPLNPAAACPAGASTCVPATSGDATLPWGGCEADPCQVPFGHGECPSGSWCNPFLGGAPSPGHCAPVGTAAPADRCDGATPCAENATCLLGRCATLCDTTGAVSGAPTCTSPFDCVDLDVDSGAELNTSFCLDTCDYDAGDDCGGPGRFCRPSAVTYLGVDICEDTPASWPSDAGLAPLATCDPHESWCGPLSGCYGLGSDAQLEWVCLPRCRTSKGGFGDTHPDCPAATPVCQDLGDSALGVCVPGE